MRETSFKTRLLGCAAIAAVGWASPVGATASISVGFPDNPPVNLTAPPAPTPLSLDQTFSARVGTARVVIQDGPSQMILAGEVQSVVTPLGGATLGESLEDVLHFSNLPGPTPITFNFLVDGTVLVPTPDFNDLVVFGDDLSPAVTMNITANSCGGVPFPRCLLVPVNTPTPVQLDIVDTVTVTNGLPQNIALSMQLNAVEGALLDFLDPRLVIDLPPGVSVTSDGGFSAVGPTPTPGVPEPSSALLLAAALGLLAAALRRVRAPVVGAIVLVAAIGAAQASELIDLQAESSKTWVIASGPLASVGVFAVPGCDQGIVDRRGHQGEIANRKSATAGRGGSHKFRALFDRHYRDRITVVGSDIKLPANGITDAGGRDTSN